MIIIFLILNDIITFNVDDTVCDVWICEDSNKSSTWVGWVNECISDSLGGIDMENGTAAGAGWE